MALEVQVLKSRVMIRICLFFFWFGLIDMSLYSQKRIDYVERGKKIIAQIDAGRHRNIHGFLLWKDGQVLSEKYWDSWDGEKPHRLQSVTKSITAILIGIAIQEGFLENIEQNVLEFFPEYDFAHLNEYKHSITIKNLLTMRSGLDWVEHPYAGSQLAKMHQQREDWIKFVLDTPMKQKPGQNYVYNSGGVIVLGGILQHISNISVQDFAHKYLFEPLGIKSARWWFEDMKGLPHTGGGLSMSVIDMLKIGRLILQEGKWKNEQIIDQQFVQSLFVNKQGKSISNIHDLNIGYSYLWHVLPKNQQNKNLESFNTFVAAWGAEGQWIMIFPRENMVIVFTAGAKNFEQETAPIRIVYESLIQWP